MTVSTAVPAVNHLFVSARGARFHVARSGVPGAPPVVLLHGIPLHWYAWRKVIAELAGEYDLYCVDLRGCGRSEATQRGYSTNDQAQDVLAVLDAIGLDRVRLIGHETGGWIGFELCLTAPERFTAFLAVNTTHPWPRRSALLRHAWRFWHTAFWEYPGAGGAVLRRWPALTRFLLRHWAGPRYSWDDDALDEFVRASRTKGQSTAIQRMLWQFVRNDIPRLSLGRDRGRTLTVPTLLLAGELDPVSRTSPVPEQQAASLSVEVLPGHRLLPETAPRLVAAAARDLFR